LGRSHQEKSTASSRINIVKKILTDCHLHQVAVDNFQITANLPRIVWLLN